MELTPRDERGLLPAGTVRVGDAARDKTAGVLRAAFEDGRLNADQFNARNDAVWLAQTKPELAVLTRDLGEQPAEVRSEFQTVVKTRPDWFARWAALALFVFATQVPFIAWNGPGNIWETSLWPVIPMVGWLVGFLGACNMAVRMSAE